MTCFIIVALARDGVEIRNIHRPSGRYIDTGEWILAFLSETVPRAA
jgi:hypothetical protein